MCSVKILTFKGAYQSVYQNGSGGFGSGSIIEIGIERKRKQWY